MSDSLQHHGLQHARLPCPSPTPRVCSNSCPLSQWCHPTISSSVIPFSCCLQSFPASGSFPVSQFFTAGGQSIEASCFCIKHSNGFPHGPQNKAPVSQSGVFLTCPQLSSAGAKPPPCSVFSSHPTFPGTPALLPSGLCASVLSAWSRPPPPFPWCIPADAPHSQRGPLPQEASPPLPRSLCAPCFIQHCSSLGCTCLLT